MSNYRNDEDRKNRDILNRLLEQLPSFCGDYFRGRQLRLSTNSAKSYAYKLLYFFEYLTQFHSDFDMDIKDIQVKDLEKVSSADLERFISWMINKNNSNKKTTISTYLSTLSAFWNYFVKRQLLTVNPTAIIDKEKPVRKKVIYLESQEKKKLLNTVEYGQNLTEMQQKYHQKLELRDYAIVTLLLDSGIRVSELVGLDVKDVNFENHYIAVIRKGGDYDEVYISDYAEGCIREYLENRDSFKPTDNSLFVSRYGSRLSVRSIEKLIKKYATVALPDKADVITVHKMRSTHAMDLLEITDNLALVQERLGHKNIATTTIYANAKKESKAGIRNLIKY